MLRQLLLLPLAFVLLFTATSVFAQTPSELESKYGPPVTAYVIRTGLLMTSRRDDNDQMCEAAIVEARTPGADITKRKELNHELVLTLIEELIPEGERGKKIRSYGLAQSQGMTSQIFYNYENVTIELVQNWQPSKGWSDNILKIKWTNRVCSGFSQEVFR
jgi:hypothetical protein